MGIIYSRKKQYDQAIASYKKSGAIIHRIYGAYHWRVADSKNNIGTIYYYKGDFSNAKKYFLEAMPIYRRHLGGIHERTAITYHNIADACLHLKEYEQATKWNQKSLAALIPDFSDTRGTTNPELSVCISNLMLMYVLDLKIQICMEKYEQSPNSVDALKLAHETAALAVAWIDRIRTEFITEESKLIQGETAKAFYQYAVQTADEIYWRNRDAAYQEKIFHYIEKSKCAVLTSLLHESKIKQSFNLPDRLLQRDKTLRGELARCRTEIQKELAKNDQSDRQNLKIFQDQYFDAFIRYQQLIDQYEQEYPEYYQLKYQIHTATLLEIQQSLNPETALLEYYITDDAIHLFVISKHKIKYRKLDIDTQFKNNLIRYIQSIKKIDAKAYLELSPQLAQVLIPDGLSSFSRLVIIPHGLLYKLPFESLVTKISEQNGTGDFSNLNYLIQDYDVSYHYSATLFRQGLQIRTLKSGSLKSDQVFAGFAPVFRSSDQNATILASHLQMIDTTAAGMDTRSISLDGKTFNALPHTENEVKDIAAAFEAHKKSSSTFLYQEASEERFKQVLSNYRIIHIATHSIMNAKNPRLSGIIFSQPQDSLQGEDGVLYTEEIYNLDLDADLLVLSSCESGTGKLRPGEGLMSLSRGFLYAGVRNLIVSLWKVDDLSTCQLMSEFYNHHIKRKSFASSLRQTKLKMIKNPETAFPRMWSGFILIGE
jgi:CHAT domain-containing protein